MRTPHTQSARNPAGAGPRSVTGGPPDRPSLAAAARSSFGPAFWPAPPTPPTSAALGRELLRALGMLGLLILVTVVLIVWGPNPR